MHLLPPFYGILQKSYFCYIISSFAAIKTCLTFTASYFSELNGHTVKVLTSPDPYFYIYCETMNSSSNVCMV